MYMNLFRTEFKFNRQNLNFITGRILCLLLGLALRLVYAFLVIAVNKFYECWKIMYEKIPIYI